jgi:hypothetical protein
MGQFSMKICASTGSLLGDNQQGSRTMVAELQPETMFQRSRTGCQIAALLEQSIYLTVG